MSVVFGNLCLKENMNNWPTRSDNSKNIVALSVNYNEMIDRKRSMEMNADEGKGERKGGI